MSPSVGLIMLVVVVMLAEDEHEEEDALRGKLMGCISKTVNVMCCRCICVYEQPGEPNAF